MFAVIKSGGRQYKVSVGETIEVNRLPVEAGAQVRFEEVLLISDSDRSMIGTPFVSDAVVVATATRQGRGEKLIVFKYKSKKRYRHRRGHRQELTILTIDDVIANGKSLVTGEAPREREAPVAEETAPGTTTEEATTDEEATDENAESTTDGQKRTRRRRTAKATDEESTTEE